MAYNTKYGGKLGWEVGAVNKTTVGIAQIPQARSLMLFFSFDSIYNTVFSFCFRQKKTKRFQLERQHKCQIIVIIITMAEEEESTPSR